MDTDDFYQQIASFGLTEQNIICHSEGYKPGVASNNGEGLPGLPKAGERMDASPCTRCYTKHSAHQVR